MKRKREAKIGLIGEGVMIVGIDIAKKRHCVKIIDSKGYELSKAMMVYNNREGFEKLESVIEVVKRKNGLKRVVIGMEPTGHYWKNIAYYFDDRGFSIVFVNPYHVHTSKEMWDNSPTKSDPKDALLIGNLIREGKFFNANLMRGVYAELRRLGKIYFRLKRKMWRAKSELYNLIDEYFPEFHNIFSSKFGKAARYILEEYFFPKEILRVGFEKMREELRRVTKCRLGENKMEDIYSVAEKSVGIKEAKNSAELEMGLVLDEIDSLQLKLKKVVLRMKQCIDKTSYGKYLFSIPGINISTVGIFLGEIGDPLRYSCSGEIIKLSGLNLKEDSSGEHIGKKKISKRGRALLRWSLCRGFLSCINRGRNKELSLWYKDLVENKKMEKTKAIVAGGTKLARIMFSLIKNKEFYDSKKILNREEIIDNSTTEGDMPVVAYEGSGGETA